MNVQQLMVYKIYQIGEFLLEEMRSNFCYQLRDVHSINKVVYFIQIDQWKELHQEESLKLHHKLKIIKLEM